MKRKAQDQAEGENKSKKMKPNRKPISLLVLPKEILETILSLIPNADLEHFVSTCKSLYAIFVQHLRAFPVRTYHMYQHQVEEMNTNSNEASNVLQQTIVMLQEEKAILDAQSAMPRKMKEWKKYVQGGHGDSSSRSIKEYCPDEECDRVWEKMFDMVSFDSMQTTNMTDITESKSCFCVGHQVFLFSSIFQSYDGPYEFKVTISWNGLTLMQLWDEDSFDVYLKELIALKKKLQVESMNNELFCHVLVHSV